MAFHVRGASRKLVEGFRPLDPIKDRPEIARRELRSLLRERRKLRRAGHYLSPGVADVIRQQVERLLREARLTSNSTESMKDCALMETPWPYCLW